MCSSVPTNINLLTASASAGSALPPSQLLVAHGVLTAVAYALGVPATVFAARYLRLGAVLKAPGGWFHAHRIVAAASVLTALAGIGVALALQVRRRGCAFIGGACGPEDTGPSQRELACGAEP